MHDGESRKIETSFQGYAGEMVASVEAAFGKPLFEQCPFDENAFTEVLGKHKLPI